MCLCASVTISTPTRSHYATARHASVNEGLRGGGGGVAADQELTGSRSRRAVASLSQ